MDAGLKRGILAAAIAASLAAYAGSDARADIYRWVDDQGTLHFTDDPSGIPAAKRDQAGTPFIKEPPKGGPENAESPGTSAQPPAESESPSSVAPSSVSPVSGENRAEALVREIEQLKAKIAAKEALVRSVEAKRSLATNPLRNRFVSPADYELYQKYQVELPGDREQLRRLESTLSGAP